MTQDTAPPSATQDFEAALTAKPPRYELQLYIAGLTPRSREAISNITRICEEHLADRYALHIIDLYQQPVLAQDHQIIAVPTLIKQLPLPLRKIIGSLADEEKVLVGLDLKPLPPA